MHKPINVIQHINRFERRSLIVSSIDVEMDSKFILHDKSLKESENRRHTSQNKNNNNNNKNLSMTIV